MAIVKSVLRVKSIKQLKIYNFKKETMVYAMHQKNVRYFTISFDCKYEFEILRYFAKLKTAKKFSTLIPISLSYRQSRGESETYLQTLFLILTIKRFY